MRWVELAARGWVGLEHASSLGFDRNLPWFELLARHGLAAGLEPGLAVGEGGAPILPLARDGRRLRALSTYYSAQYAPLMEGADDAALAGLLRDLRLQGRSTRLELRPLPREDALYPRLLHALHAAGWRTHQYFCFGNWTLPVGGRSYEAFASTLPGEVRSTLKRKGKRFDKAGGQLKLLCTPAEADEAVAAFQTVYAASWKRPEPFPEFMPELIRLMAATGRMRMGVATLEGQPIAAQFWIVDQGVASIYKLAYDEAHAQWSAGSLLTAGLMRQALDEDRVDVVDYLIGDEPYKQDWMSHRRERWGVLAFNPASVDGLSGWALERARHCVRAVLRRR
ncbi:MAG: GNAT family N-acetyltransferase [Rhodocyclaceae bacterium]|nr:GNAT family N-acetyltransferase [Rhodocyclaceae bacterium]